MIKKYIGLLIVIILTLSATSRSLAGEVFRYKFERDTLHYNLSILSNLQFTQLQSLAELLDIDSLKNVFDMDIDMVAKPGKGKNGSIVKLRFNRISSVTIVGDSVISDDNVGWGRVKPGSEFLLLISDRGEIRLMNKINIKAGRQVVDMIQRFMPVFPEKPISEKYGWPDTVSFDIELPQQETRQIETIVNYTYSGDDPTTGMEKFDYLLNNSSSDSSQIYLAGYGKLEFDSDEGFIEYNEGDITIDTEISLSVFGLPEMLGTTPLHIDSKIKLNLVANE